MSKSLPMPIIDLGGSVKVISEVGGKFVWKKIGTLSCASHANAKKLLKSKGLSSGWLFDDLGHKEFVTVK